MKKKCILWGDSVNDFWIIDEGALVVIKKYYN